MCNVVDDQEEAGTSQFMQKKHKFDPIRNTCIKCRSAKVKVVLHSKYPYCTGCFLENTVHKFKALLGKNRITFLNENVLVYYKAGHSSTALLHFLRTGLDLNTPKKIRFIPMVVFFEKGYGLSVPHRLSILKQIGNSVKQFGFPIYFVSLTQYVYNRNLSIHTNADKIILDDNDTSYLKSVLISTSNVSTQTEILRILENELLIKVAKYLNCRSVFIPNVGIDIAAQLLTNMSLGRGEHALFDTGAIDSRDSDVSILRPLRYFSAKELVFYNFFNNLESVYFLSAEDNPYLSIQNLMEKFVSDLQVNYPATISTIVRTGDKLDFNKNLMENYKCKLCGARLANKSKIFGSEEAMQFSHWISTRNVKESSSAFTNIHNTNYCFSCSQIASFLVEC